MMKRTPLAVVVVLATAWPAAGEAPDPRADLAGFWQAVVETNRVWLEPSDLPLSYTLTSELKPGDQQPLKMVNGVWASGDRFRFEMERFAPPLVSNPSNRWAIVSDGQQETYLDGPDQLVARGARPARGFGRLRQGVTMQTAMHAALPGLPENARVVEGPAAGEAGVVVVAADLGDARCDFGLGLYHSWFGYADSRLGEVRLHVRVPELTPVLEEHLVSDTRIEYADEFLAFGDRHAPTVVRHTREINFGDAPKDWVLEARFQKTHGRWLLDRAVNLQNGEPVAEMALTDLSTEPIDPARLSLDPAADD